MSNPSLRPADHAVEVVPLAPADRDEGWLLARTARPDLTLDRWRGFDGDWRRDGDQRGVVAARNTRGALLGLAFWWRQPDLEAGQALWAGPIVVRELGVRPLVRRAMLQALTEAAGRLGARLRLAPDDDRPEARSIRLVERASANKPQPLDGRETTGSATVADEGPESGRCS